MKRLFTSLFLLTSAYLSAQTFEIYNGMQSTTNVAGTTVNVQVSNEGYEGFFIIKRTDGDNTPITVKITRKQLSTPTEMDLEELCWGPSPDVNSEGTCYAVPTDVEHWAPNGFKTISDKGLMEIHFIGMTLPANISYRYYIENTTGQKLDSVDLNLSGTLSIKETKPVQNISYLVYPSPANDILNVSLQGATTDNNSVRIVDVLGKVVYEDRMASMKKIDVSSFNNGVYVLTIFSNGRAVQTKRIVVKH